MPSKTLKILYNSQLSLYRKQYPWLIILYHNHVYIQNKVLIRQLIFGGGVPDHLHSPDSSVPEIESDSLLKLLCYASDSFSDPRNRKTCRLDSQIPPFAC